METSQKNILISKIKQLSVKRQHHQKIISQLLNEQLPTSSTLQPINFNLLHQYKKQATLLTVTNKKQTQNNECKQAAQQTSRSTLSIFSLSHQVNLDTYLCNNPQSKNSIYTSRANNFDHQIQNISKKQGKLKNSLKKQFKNCTFGVKINKNMNKVNLLVNQKFVDFSIIVQFLNTKELWEDVFVEKNNQFYASICEEFCEQINQQVFQGLLWLSKDQLKNEQIDMIVPINDFDQSCSQNSENQDKQIFIGYLLLYRLLNSLKTGLATLIIQHLMGYPFKSFNIHSTTSYFSLANTLHSPNAPSFLALGYKNFNKSLENIKYQTLKSYSPLNLLEKYHKITLIEQMQHVCLKKLKLTQRVGHYSIVDIQNLQEKETQFWVTFHVQTLKLQKGNQQCHANENTYGFHYCLIGQQGQIISYSQNMQQNRQSFNLKLASQSEYKLYVSFILTQSSKINQQPVSFNIILHSKNQLSSIPLSLKISPSYNIMTQTLINRYLIDYANLDQVEKQLIRLSNIFPQANIIIVRANLKLMGLGIDFISVQQIQTELNKLENKREIQIQYQNEDNNGVLCDRNYIKNRIKIKKLQQINQVYLRKLVRIKSCAGLNFQMSELIL